MIDSYEVKVETKLSKH